MLYDLPHVPLLQARRGEHSRHGLAWPHPGNIYLRVFCLCSLCARHAELNFKFLLLSLLFNCPRKLVPAQKVEVRYKKNKMAIIHYFLAFHEIICKTSN